MDTGLPLKGGMLSRVPPTASLQEIATATNEVIDRLNGLLKTQIFSDGTSKRMIIGFQANGWGAGKDFGIKISMEGIDVTQATDDQLLFKMDLATWRWFDPDSRNFVNIGLRSSGTYGFEMAKPGVNLDDPA
jgi:hypothetical protein